MGRPMPLNTRPSMSRGHPQLEGVPQKADLGLRQIDAGGGLKQLHHGGITVDLQHLAAADGAVRQLDLPSSS